MRFVCFGHKTEVAYSHIMTGVNCNDYKTCYLENGREKGAKYTARNIKPECSGCGLANTKSHLEQTEHLNTSLD